MGFLRRGSYSARGFTPDPTKRRDLLLQVWDCKSLRRRRPGESRGLRLSWGSRGQRPARPPGGFQGGALPVVNGWLGICGLQSRENIGGKT
jgi:hypothetical protein